MSPVKRRVEEYDFVKGLLIIFVIWGHVCMYSTPTHYDGNFLTYIIRLFQMPMFIMISGMFYKPVYNVGEGIKRSKKIFKHIAIPLIFWVGLTSITTLAIGMKDSFSLLGIFNVIRGSISVYWYFICLLLCMYYTMLLTIFFKNHKSLWGGVITLCLIPFNIYNFQFLYLFFVIGMIISEYKLIIIDKWKRINSWLKVGLLTFVVIGSQYYPTSLTFYSVSNFIFGELNIEIFGGSFKTPAIVFILVRSLIYLFSTFMWLLLFCESLQYLRSSISRTIKSIGKETLFLFVSHLYILVCFTDIIHQIFDCNNLTFLSNPIVRYYGIDIIVTSIMVIGLYKAGMYLSRFKTLSQWMQGKV